jgi:hypothetical protein
MPEDAVVHVTTAGINVTHRRFTRSTPLFDGLTAT